MNTNHDNKAITAQELVTDLREEIASGRIQDAINTIEKLLMEISRGNQFLVLWSNGKNITELRNLITDNYDVPVRAMQAQKRPDNAARRAFIVFKATQNGLKFILDHNIPHKNGA